MKKFFLTLLLFGCAFQLPIASVQFKPAPVQQEVITKKMLDNYNSKRFQEELKTTKPDVIQFKNEIEKFKQHVQKFAQQPLNFQKNYDNFAQLLINLEHIQQKPVSITITKLAQYKSAAQKQDLSLANNLIEGLDKTISDTENSFQTILASKPDWSTTTFNPNKKIDSQVTLTEAFNDTLIKIFPVRIKKIKRSIINWKRN